MGRHSSDSDNSRSNKYKKSKKSSRRSSSRSASPKKCKKKLKKYKRSSQSSSRSTKSRHSSSSKSVRRRRSRSRSNHSRKRSTSRDSDRKWKDDSRKSKHSRYKKKYRSTSDSSRSSSSSAKTRSPTPKRKYDYNPDELLERLNKAAIEAMAANKKIKPEPLASMEMQIKRQDIINELRASGSKSIFDQTAGIYIPSVVTPGPPPFLTATDKSTDKTATDEAPTIVNETEIGPSVNPTSTQSNDSTNNLLHPNFLLENQEEKLNRWVKKLYQIRQRAISGDLLSI